MGVVDGNQNRDGANIQLWECDSRNYHMQWTYKGDGIYANSNGKCMVVDHNHAYNGANVQLWSCNGYEHYKAWIFGYCKGPGCSVLRGSVAEDASDRNITSLPVSTTNDTDASALRTMHSSTYYGQEFRFQPDSGWGEYPIVGMRFQELPHAVDL